MLKMRDKIIYGIIAFLVLLALGKAFFTESEPKLLKEDEVFRLAEQWELIEENQEEGRYAYRIPENTEGDQVLSLKIYWQDFKVYLEDREIYTYSDIYGEKGAFIHWIELPEDAAGKTLYLEMNGSQRSRQSALKSTSMGKKERSLYPSDMG